MKDMIGLDQTVIEHVCVLAQLELTEKEKKQAAEDMEQMLSYIRQLQELDTSKAEPLMQLHPVTNVFRSDEITGGDGRESILSGAPGGTKNSGLKVPKTVQ